ncbi:MAG: membrane protein insertase YidC [Verrucomicrobiaceae bacterium]|nr:MAG: membrane protein insertase YidC [Verrucomicrobiaceae bacterium]
MYDRKTWVVLILCGAILAANVYYSSKNAETARIAEEAQKKNAAAVAAVQSADPAAGAPALTVDTPPPPTEESTVVLQNDKIIFTLTNIGGGIKYAELKEQHKVGSKTELVQINRFGAGPIGGLTGANEALENIPYAYKADESVEGKKAVYIAKLPSGLIAKKTFSLVESDKAGAPYLLDFLLELDNTAANAINLNQWSIFLGEASPLYQSETPDQTGFFWHEKGNMHYQSGTGFRGNWISSAKSIIRSDSASPIEFAGVTNQFFATVVRQKQPAVASVWGKREDERLTNNAAVVTSVRAGLPLPATTLAPKEPRAFSYQVFIGPKHNTLLRKMDGHGEWGKGWGDVMQYGSWLQWVARPLNSLLNIYHNLIDGLAKTWAWGLAIILLTITVRIFIWPLHAKSTHTMKRMAKLQPKMAELKEKYPDDQNKQSAEMMGLYRKYGINPLGGCLPMFLQIPIFFGFYKMLQYAVELRGQSFLWVHDLSQPDTLLHIGFLGGLPLNILPIVMAITSFLQIRMTPKTGDPTQQKIIMFMPFIFFFFCYNFASALALYWTTQNIFSIGQTWLMNKIPEPELKERSVSERKSWMQRMAEQAAAQQKAKANGGNGQGNLRDVTPKKPRPPRTGG